MSAPGWHPDPHHPGHQRYFDGATWTEHVHPPMVASDPFPRSKTRRAWLIGGGLMAVTVLLCSALLIALIHVGSSTDDRSVRPLPGTDRFLVAGDGFDVILGEQCLTMTVSVDDPDTFDLVRCAYDTAETDVASVPCGGITWPELFSLMRALDAAMLAPGGIDREPKPAESGPLDAVPGWQVSVYYGDRTDRGGVWHTYDYPDEARLREANGGTMTQVADLTRDLLTRCTDTPGDKDPSSPSGQRS